MCGIAGGLHPKPSPAEVDAVLRSMYHRGPDSSGSISDDTAWLAAVRLAIQDLSYRGDQPLQSPDRRYTIVFNGEIYNHWELRKELERYGLTFRSASDTETLLAAYVQWDKDCLHKLNGIFAFAVWDSAAKKLFIARDGMGVKPLYYYWDSAGFAFASEIKTLLCLSHLDKTLQPDAFYNYLLLLYNPDEQTPFKHVKKLMPGHTLEVSEGRRPVIQQWHYLSFSEGEDRTEEEWIVLAEKTLLQATECQLLSDAPVGFLLSGGLDSSLLVAMAARLRDPQNLKCFTLDTGTGMAREGFGDDAAYARKAAKHIGIHTEDIPDSGLHLKEHLDKTIWHLDEPQADPAAMQVGSIAAAAASQSVKVLLGGAGADDIFSGYRRHQAIYWNTKWERVPDVFKHAVIGFAKSFGGASARRRLQKLEESGLLKGEEAASLFFWIKEQDAAGLFTGDISIAKEQTRTLFRNISRENPDALSRLNNTLLLEQRTFLPHHNLNYLDKMMMANGVEGRVPYLNNDVVRLANSLPESLKMKGAQTKHILRKVAQKYLPAEIINRPKTGFGAPLRSWMTGDNMEWAKERLMDKSFAAWNIFSPAAIAELLQGTATGKRDGAYTILSLLSIESWLRQFALTNGAPA